MANTYITDVTNASSGVNIGNYIRINQFDHGMFDSRNKLKLDNIKPNTIPTKLNSNLDNESVLHIFMIQGLLSDPSFIPVTIVFVLFILFAYWQQLNKYVPYLSIVYIAFTIVTALSYNNDNQDRVEHDYEVENASSSKYVAKDTLLNEIISENKNTSLQVESSSSFEIKEYVPKEKKSTNLSIPLSS